MLYLYLKHFYAAVKNKNKVIFTTTQTSKNIETLRFLHIVL